MRPSKPQRATVAENNSKPLSLSSEPQKSNRNLCCINLNAQDTLFKKILAQFQSTTFTLQKNFGALC